jgi:hypothetical protein
VQSFLTLNRPWQGTGNASDWTFSGPDENTLRECLDSLVGFEAADSGDRWEAAIVFGPVEGKPVPFRRGRKYGVRPGTAERAWTIDGALALAEILPDSLSGLRDDLKESFAARKAGWPGDATTPPRSTS